MRPECARNPEWRGPSQPKRNGSDHEHGEDLSYPCAELRQVVLISQGGENDGDINLERLKERLNVGAELGGDLRAERDPGLIRDVSGGNSDCDETEYTRSNQRDPQQSVADRCGNLHDPARRLCRRIQHVAHSPPLYG